jgi:hypothetical protein
MTEIHPTPDVGGCTVRPSITYSGRDQRNDVVDVALVTFEFALPAALERCVLCLVRNRRTREVSTRICPTLSDAVTLMEHWLGEGVPL